MSHPTIGEQLAERPGWSALLAFAVVASLVWAAGLGVVSVMRGPLENQQDEPLIPRTMERVERIEAGETPEDVAVLAEGEVLVWIGRPDGEPVAMAGPIFPLESPVPPEIGGLSSLRLDANRHFEVGFETKPVNLRVASEFAADGDLVVLSAADIEEIDDRLLDRSRIVFALAVLLGAVAALVVRRRVAALGNAERR